MLAAVKLLVYRVPKVAKPDQLQSEKQTLHFFEAVEGEGLTAAPPLLAIDDVVPSVRIESALHVCCVTGGHIWFWERKPGGSTGHMTQKKQQAATDGEVVCFLLG